MKKENFKANKRKSDRTFWLLSLGAIGLGGLIGIVILFCYKPRAYQPVQPTHSEQVSLYLTNELGPDFFNQVQLDQPFELIVQQSGINDIAAGQDWIQDLGELSLTEPTIVFSDHSILLMGNLKYKKISSVLSILAFPTIDSNQQICMNIQSVRLGMLPVTQLIGKLCQKALDDNRDAFMDDPEVEKIVQAIIRNEPFDPVFVISDHRVRIVGFTIEHGILTLTLLPEKNLTHPSTI